MTWTLLEEFESNFSGQSFNTANYDIDVGQTKRWFINFSDMLQDWSQSQLRLYLSYTVPAIAYRIQIPRYNPTPIIFRQRLYFEFTLPAGESNDGNIRIEFRRECIYRGGVDNSYVKFRIFEDI